VGREGEEGDLVDSKTQTRQNAPSSAHESVAPGGGISFQIVDQGKLEWDFGDSKSDVSDSTPELAGRSLIRGRRGLDVGKCQRARRKEGQGDCENPHVALKMVHEWPDKQKLAGSAVGAGLFFQFEMPGRVRREKLFIETGPARVQVPARSGA
jgi:hypothetical protein